MGAGVYADHDAGGRIIDNLFSADGLDIDAMSTAKIEVSQFGVRFAFTFKGNA